LSQERTEVDRRNSREAGN